MSAHLIGKLEYVPELGFYALRRVDTASVDADHLAREFDGKTTFVTLLSKDAPSYGEALKKLRTEVESRAETDGAWIPILEMFKKSRSELVKVEGE
jgi:hypothetical protein